MKSCAWAPVRSRGPSSSPRPTRVRSPRDLQVPCALLSPGSSRLGLLCCWCLLPRWHPTSQWQPLLHGRLTAGLDHPLGFHRRDSSEHPVNSPFFHNYQLPRIIPHFRFLQILTMVFLKSCFFSCSFFLLFHPIPNTIQIFTRFFS